MTILDAQQSTRRLLGPADPAPPPVLDLPALLSLLDSARLQGRGGAGFPTVRKVRAVADAGRSPVVVGNAMEGEPLSRKDAALLMRSPGLVLDGLTIVGRALGASRLILALGPEVARAAAVEPAAERGIEVRTLTGGFVAGQETALVNQLDGGPAVPTDGLVRVTTRGVGGRPTLVLNAETLAQVALLARHGATEPETTLYTLSGAVTWPGVVEAERGARLADVLAAAGPVEAPVLVGGYHGAWLPTSARHVRLDAEGLSPYSASVGAGVLHVLDPATCPLVLVAEVTTYLAQQSARQCGPCVNGLPRMAELLGRLANGPVDASLPGEIERLRLLVTGRGACAHPDGTARLVGSTLRVFAPHVTDHLNRRCEHRS